MFVRNFLTAGDYITIVPEGIQATLQYDVEGRIEKIFNGPDNTYPDISSQMLSIVLEQNLVPRTISVKNGSSYISGVFYTTTHSTVTGLLNSAECIDDYIKMFKKDPKSFRFLAGSITSDAAVYSGAVNTRHWLVTSKFDVLPGYAYTQTLDEDKFIHIMRTSTPEIEFPFVQGYIVYHQGTPRYYDLGFKRATIIDVKLHVDDLGGVYGQVKVSKAVAGLSNGTLLDYGVIVKHNIQKNTCVLLDEAGVIFHAYPSNGKPVEPLPNVLTCPSCGMQYVVNLDGRTVCPNQQCNSRLFSETNRLLSGLHLPSITVDKYKEAIKLHGKGYTVVDILDEPEFVSQQTKVSLADALRAVIPYSAVSVNSSFITRFCNHCNNSANTVEYYLYEYDRLRQEVPGQDTDKFVAWLCSSTGNTPMLCQLLQHPVLSIDSSNVRFEGAPIFRNWHILITGDFAHGNRSDIEAILRSYSAEIATNPEEATCLILGDLQENINGRFVNKMRAANKPVYSEHQFFAEYDIDSDLAANL